MSKPVAWLWSEDGCNLSVNLKKDYQHDIPLYTHPHKQLSDEEIEEIAKNNWVWDENNMQDWSVIRFARAIIKEITE